MGEATSAPDPLLTAAALGAFAVLLLLSVAAMLTPHVRAWHANRRDPWVRLARGRR